MSAEAGVAKHYTHGKLEQAILDALQQAGKHLEHLTAEDLSPVDEFHLGGLESTKELAAQMELRPGLRLLDVGSGIGGPARYFASAHACHVAGIDLTEEFVQVAQSLTRLLKLHALAEFRQASALALPFDDGVFDRAYMIHVGMNIGDKAGVYREVKRVLKPGGLFAIFDIVRTGPGAMRYPVPWAASEETSFVDDLEVYRDALRAAGFAIKQERRRGGFAIEFIERMLAGAAQSGRPAGLHLLAGERMPLMIRNVLAMLREGVLEPVEMIARA